MQINNKQRWNKDKCRCECKELIDERICDKGFIWNPIVNLNVINHVMLENIQVIEIVSVLKVQLINQLKNVVKIFMSMNYIQL